MLTERERFDLWRAAMTDPVLASGGFACTKQDLRAYINQLDADFDGITADMAAESAAKVADPVYNEAVYAERVQFEAATKDRALTKAEQDREARLPRPPVKVAEALSPAQHARLFELLAAVRNPPAPEAPGDSAFAAHLAGGGR